MSEAAPASNRRFSLAHLLLAAPWVALVIDAWAPIGDNSFLWHVRAGTLQAESGSVLTTDPFSYTAGGEAWMTQSWLAELIYAGLEDWLGLGFVPWMLLSITALTFLGVGLIAYRFSKSVAATATVLILTTISLISFLVPRPVIFSYLLFVMVVLAWERPTTRWTLPFLFWAWASMHGSFFLGLAYVGLRLLSRREWKTMPVVVASGLVTLLTAHGFGVVTMLLDFVAARPYLGLLTEWRTPELFSPVFLPVFIGIAILLYGAMKQRLEPADLWVIVPFLAVAMTALRSVPPAWLALIVPISMALATVGTAIPRRFGAVPTVVIGVALLALPFLLIGDGGLADDRFPVAIHDELVDAPTFHNDVVGGYLIWEMGPDFEVYIDDRAELYQERLELFVDIRAGREPWEPEFDRYQVSQALLAEDEPMVEWLEDAGWVTVADDEGFVLLRDG